MGNTVEVARTIVPKNVDDWEVLEMGSRDFKIRYFKGEGGMDEDVDGN